MDIAQLLAAPRAHPDTGSHSWGICRCTLPAALGHRRPWWHASLKLIQMVRCKVTRECVLCWCTPMRSAHNELQSRNFPIHFYVFGRTATNCRPEVVTALLDKHPSSVRHRNLRGNMPLKLAVCYDAPLKVVRRLYQEYPAAIDELDQVLGVAARCWEPHDDVLIPH